MRPVPAALCVRREQQCSDLLDAGRVGFGCSTSASIFEESQLAAIGNYRSTDPSSMFTGVPVVPSFRGFSPSSALASRVKQRNRHRGGRAEVMLRKAVWHLGLRYRTHFARLPGKPDLVFTRARVCVFVDGDFWHGRHWPRLCEQLRRRANSDYWIPKIERNISRDAAQTSSLVAAGWTVLRFWETDVLCDPQSAALEVQTLVKGAPASVISLGR
jgi:DNA mismatch endonuclease, patch repair protein